MHLKAVVLRVAPFCVTCFAKLKIVHCSIERQVARNNSLLHDWVIMKTINFKLCARYLSQSYCCGQMNVVLLAQMMQIMDQRINSTVYVVVLK